MTAAPSNARAIAAMLFATASFVGSDTCMKLVTDALPPFEVLFLRGIAATLCSGALVVGLGQGRAVPRAFSKFPLLRAGFETVGVLCYIVALARMPIADVIAICQTAPLLFILLVATIQREWIGAARVGLIAVGFVGALLVAQPDATGFSPAALLAFATALGIAFRDVASRKVAAHIPALAVTFATNLIVLAGAGAMMLLTEDVAMPSGMHLLYMLASGAFVTAGHFGIFMAYRLGTPGVVAPFFYSFAIWAVISGLIFFDELPNPLALVGIAAILASGLGIVLFGRRRVRAAAPG